MNVSSAAFFVCNDAHKMLVILRYLCWQSGNFYCADFIFIGAGDLIAGVIGNLIGWRIRKMEGQPNKARRHRISNPDSCFDATTPGCHIDELLVYEHQLAGIGGVDP